MSDETHGKIVALGQYIAIPHAVMRSADYRNLSGTAVKLLCALLLQLDDRINGDFTAAFTVMHRQHGFRSTDTLARAIRELLAANIINKTRKAHGGRCALYAVTWLPITPPKKPSLRQLLGQAK